MAGMLQYRSDSAGDVQRDVGIQWLVCYGIGQIVLGMYSGMWAYNGWYVTV